MPWPPTGELDPLTDMADDLGVPQLPGMEGPDLFGVPVDITAGGVMAPGVLSPAQEMFSALPSADEGRLQLPESKAVRQAVIDYASAKLGMNYVWGGESDAEGGFDCSGLLFYAFKKAGVDIPRVSFSQARRGTEVGLDQLQPGDLVAWENNPYQDGADHIALYLGNGQILEAPHAGAKVRIRKLGAKEGAWGVHLNY